MKSIGLLVLLLVCSTSYGQLFALVDKDGYVNVRAEGDNKASIVRQLTSGDLVFVFDENYDKKADWQNVSFSDERIGEGGFVHNSRLKALTSFDKLPLAKASFTNVTLEGKGIKVEMNIDEVDFEENKRDFIPQYKTGDGAYNLVGYKEQEAWGIEGLHKLSHYTSIAISKYGNTIELPVTSFENMFNPSLKPHCVFDRENDTIYIYAYNGDGAGAYIVAWIIKGDTYIGRFVTRPF